MTPITLLAMLPADTTPNIDFTPGGRPDAQPQDHPHPPVIGQLISRALPLASVVALSVGPLAGTAFAFAFDTAPTVDPIPAQGAALVPGTPCNIGVKACVSLGEQRAWLTDGSKVISGPVNIISGGLGQETPSGDFTVQRKSRDHKSSEHQTPEGLPSPMPWSVFFAPGGIALHEGTLSRPSAGCVRLPPGEAQRYFDTLQIGDKVQVRGG